MSSVDGNGFELHFSLLSCKRFENGVKSEGIWAVGEREHGKRTGKLAETAAERDEVGHEELVLLEALQVELSMDLA